MTPPARPAEAEVALEPTGTTGTLHTHVAVVGGGVAGLALAAGLLRLGLSVLVLERSSTDAGARGFAFMLMGNGLQELDDLGLLEAVRRRGHSSYSVAVRMPDGSLCEERQIEEHLCIRRADLVDALAQQLPQGVLRAGAEVVAVDAADGSVSALRLADGTRVEAGLYVGADGSNS
jgi:salicylate hydroxylase